MTIQSVTNIGKRILALKALLVRTRCEGIIHLEKDPTKREGAKRAVLGIDEWMKANDIYSYISAKEKELLTKNIGSWIEKEFINSIWRIESIATLFWSIGLYTLPPYDTQVDEDAIRLLLKDLPNLESVLTKAHLREESEITTARDTAELWHWRARTTRIILDNQIPSGFTKEKLWEICTLASQKSYEAGDIPKPIDGDFPAYGKAYKNLSPHEFQSCMSIAMERHFTINWLCGYGKNWDETPTDT